MITLKLLIQHKYYLFILQKLQSIVLIKKNKFMTNSLKLKRNPEIFQLSKETVQLKSILSRNNLLYSKFFWICSIYFFISISLLTGLHMYEYFKINYC